MRASVLRKTSIVVLIVFGAIYAMAFINQFSSKGWRSNEARSLASQISAHAANKQLPMRVNMAQEYSDGCSFWALEIYWRPCFSIHVALHPKARIAEVEEWGLRELVVREFRTDQARDELILGGINSSAKIRLEVERYAELVRADGTRTNSLIEKNQITIEVK